MKTGFAAAALASLALALAACGQSTTTQGNAEEAGEAADTQFEQTTQGGTDMSDGPLENAGEAIDEAKQNADEAAQDAKAAADRAHDGDPSTNP